MIGVLNFLFVVVVEEPQKVVSSVPGSYKDSEHVGNLDEMFDVIVCGGTLGIFIATALSSKGFRVGVVERNVLKGVMYYTHCLSGIQLCYLELVIYLGVQ